MTHSLYYFSNTNIRDRKKMLVFTPEFPSCLRISEGGVWSARTAKSQ